ncbi:MAG: phage tail sheath family protein [Anaerolineae bacterium]|nr:phage tail sheath family protein [Anaerolineae bacterium]
MNSAPDGTLLRVGASGVRAKPASVASNLSGPFLLNDNSKLLLTVGGTPKELTFKGEAAVATGDNALADTVTLTAGHGTLEVEIDGVRQKLTLAEGDVARATLVDQLNAAIRGGFARLEGDNKLSILSDKRGAAASVKVFTNADFGFTADKTDVNAPDANNTVADLLRVSVQEINTLLTDAGIDARAALLPNGQFVLATTATGTTSALEVRSAAGSVEGVLGFAPGTKNGADGQAITYYVKSGNGWRDSSGTDLSLAGLGINDAPSGGAEIMTLTVVSEDGDGSVTVVEELAFDSHHPRWIGTILSDTPTRRADYLYHRYVFTGEGVDAFTLVNALFGMSDEIVIVVTGGNDGVTPITVDYETALEALIGLEDIAIVAAPGYSAYGDDNNYQGIQNALISHAERRRSYRIAVLDSQPDQLPSEVRSARGKIDSKYAALYYPWVVVPNPLARPGLDNVPSEIALPPSGFVTGIYARNDIERGVYKAPANEVVRSALRFELDINFAQQEVLNPLGVNCLRYLSGRGYRVWGARTASSDPEWKYVNVRRYFNYLEASIDRGTQWAVFEPNGERLWANIRGTIEAFLYNEWVSGALLGGSTKEAFFVRCDRSTMTQNDLDNGRLICLIGVAVIKPAEFVIFRIGQKTADARS